MVYPEFDESRLYTYPDHLRAAITDLPSLPGVYIFHGEEGDLPLYVGKSINIRSRVLAHLRTADEARMLRQTRRITFERTAGEIGALLLEAQLIKQLQPLHNRRLRARRQLLAWKLTAGVPELVSARDVNFAHEPDLYGLYSSRHSAEQHLRDLADLHGLCYGVLGLEKLSAGRACFRAQLRQCLGACCGRESLQVHQSRFMAAVQDMGLVCWPYASAIALVEQQEDLLDMHVLRNWCYLGRAHTLEQARALDTAGTVNACFDADSYKILCRPVVEGTVRIVAL